MRTPTKDWHALIALFHSSGLSHSKFCKRHKVNFHTFRYWLYKIRDQQSEPDEELQWLPVTITSPLKTESSVSLRFGHTELTFSNLPDPRYLSSLMLSLHSEDAQ